MRNGTVVQRTAYDLDADGNRTALRTLAGVESYVLDAADQLTSVTYPGERPRPSRYDAAGNRLTRARSGSATPVTYIYDDASQLRLGRLASPSATTPTATWSTTARTTLRLGLAQPDDAGPDGRRAPWVTPYDGAGNRVATTAVGATSRQLYDLATDDGSPELLADGSTSSCRVRPGWSTEDTGSRRRYPLVDAVGSVRSVTDASGAVVGTTTYDPFGVVRSQSGTVSRFGFGGGLADGRPRPPRRTRPRHGSGRFLSVDPVRPGGPGVVGWNPYTYAANNPTTYTDPSGRAVAIEYSNLLKIGRRLPWRS